MAAATLGSFGFVAWNGETAPYRLPESNLLVETRAGVDAFEVWEIGTIGEPFQVDTVAVYGTYADAVTAKRNYELSKGSSGLALTFSTQVLNYRFKVLDVKAQAKSIVRAVVAGDNTNYTALVRARWTIVAYPFTEPE